MPNEDGSTRYVTSGIMSTSSCNYPPILNSDNIVNATQAYDGLNFILFSVFKRKSPYIYNQLNILNRVLTRISYYVDWIKANL